MVEISQTSGKFAQQTDPIALAMQAVQLRGVSIGIIQSVNNPLDRDSVGEAGRHAAADAQKDGGLGPI